MFARFLERLQHNGNSSTGEGARRSVGAYLSLPVSQRSCERCSCKLVLACSCIVQSYLEKCISQTLNPKILTTIPLNQLCWDWKIWKEGRSPDTERHAVIWMNVYKERAVQDALVPALIVKTCYYETRVQAMTVLLAMGMVR